MTQPWNSDDVNHTEVGLGVVSGFRHRADDFMAGYHVRPMNWKIAFDDVEIGSAHAARSDSDQQLPGRR